MSSYVIVQTKLPKVLSDAVNDLCRRKGLDFNELLAAMLVFGMEFDICAKRGRDIRGYKKAIKAWINLNKKY